MVISIGLWETFHCGKTNKWHYAEDKKLKRGKIFQEKKKRKKIKTIMT